MHPTPTTCVAARIPTEYVEQLQAIANQQETTISRVIRAIVGESLDKSTAITTAATA